MNEFKTLDWSYPTSPNAIKFKFPNGCWTVSICGLHAPVAVKSFASRLDALRFAARLPQPWGAAWKSCAIESQAMGIEPRREKLIAIVGHDFIDAKGARSFCLQLCQRTARGLSSVAILRNDTKPDVVDCLRSKLPAMQRLARIYMRRSIPQHFI